MKRKNRKLLPMFLLFIILLSTLLFLLPKEMISIEKLSTYYPHIKNKILQKIDSQRPVNPDSQQTNPETDPNKNPNPDPIPAKPEYTDITISSVGDILIHNTVYLAAYDPATKDFDFRSQFEHVKPYLEKADITIANLETSLGGSERGYAGYPEFNTPDSIIDALRYAGIDIVTAANNHRMDMGVTGFYRTIRTVRSKGLDIIGVKSEEKEKTYVMKDIKGIKTAFVNFGYSYPLRDGSLSVNGLILPVNMRGLMDTFDPQDLEQSTKVIASRIAEARQDGAQVVVLMMHWGDEYHRMPNIFQKELAQRLVDLGANVILGGHPHVMQPAVLLTNSEGRRVPVFYSQGNFISDQRKETVDDIYTEQGMIANVTFRVYPEKGITQLLDASAIPTWVNKKRPNNRFFYEVIPVEDALRDMDKFPMLTSQDIDRIRTCYDTVNGLTVGLK